jgi:hypothetical protein
MEIEFVKILKTELLKNLTQQNYSQLNQNLEHTRITLDKLN